MTNFQIDIEDLEKEIIKILKSNSNINLRISDGGIVSYYLTGFYNKKEIIVCHYKKSKNTRFFVDRDGNRIAEGYSLIELQQWVEKL